MTGWRDLPKLSSDTFAPRYLYLCRFETVAKVGVSANASKRIAGLARQYGPVAEAIVLVVGYWESSRREALIAATFGFPTKRAGRRTEIFPTEHFAAAAVMVHRPTPEFRQRWLGSERRRAALETAYLQRKAA
jgi:hypothetical protein